MHMHPVLDHFQYVNMEVEGLGDHTYLYCAMTSGKQRVDTLQERMMMSFLLQ